MATEPGGDHPPVVRRRRRRVWPWVAGLAALLLALFLVPLMADDIFTTDRGGSGRLVQVEAPVIEPPGASAKTAPSATSASQAAPPASPSPAAPGAVASPEIATADASPSVARPGPSPSPRDQQTATLDQLLDRPATFFGRTVTVEGGVVEVLSPRTFRLSGDQLTEDEAILVVSTTPRPDATGLLEGDRVRVTGAVRAFDVAEVERATGYSLDAALYADWEDEPVVVATAITVTSRDPAIGPNITGTPAASPDPRATPDQTTPTQSGATPDAQPPATPAETPPPATATPTG